MMRFGLKLVVGAVVCLAFCVRCEGQRAKKNAVVTVPLEADKTAKAQSFRDGKFGVSFVVPAGWELSRKDGEVSTFHLDARSAPPTDEMRGVATLSFNPYPQTTLSGAIFYYSVEKKSTDEECAQQAAGHGGAGRGGAGRAGTERSAAVKSRVDDVNIGGMNFKHGYDQQGGICVEQRDNVYTAYRKGSCYRFDLALNTFCAVSSGAREMADQQMHDIEGRLSGILSTVVLEWEKGGASAVPVPANVKMAAPETPEAAKPVAKVGTGF